MNEKPGIIYDDVKKCVDEVINYVGKDITFAMTLALGKTSSLLQWALSAG